MNLEGGRVGIFEWMSNFNVDMGTLTLILLILFSAIKSFNCDTNNNDDNLQLVVWERRDEILNTFLTVYHRRKLITFF